MLHLHWSLNAGPLFPHITFFHCRFFCHGSRKQESYRNVMQPSTFIESVRESIIHLFTAPKIWTSCSSTRSKSHFLKCPFDELLPYFSFIHIQTHTATEKRWSAKNSGEPKFGVQCAYKVTLWRTCWCTLLPFHAMHKWNAGAANRLICV